MKNVKQPTIISDNFLDTDFFYYELIRNNLESENSERKEMQQLTVDTILKLQNKNIIIKLEGKIIDKKWLDNYLLSDDLYFQFEIYYNDFFVRYFSNYHFVQPIDEIDIEFSLERLSSLNDKDAIKFIKNYEDIYNNFFLKNMVLIYKKYANDFLNKLKSKNNIVYNPSVDKHKKPYYFNEQRDVLHLDTYFERKFYNEDYLEYYSNYIYESLSDLLKTICNDFKLYYKIYKLYNSEYIVLNSIKTNDTKMLIKIINE